MKQAQVISGAALAAVLLGAGYWQSVFSGQQAFWLAVTITGSYAVYWLYQNNYLGDLNNPFEEAQQASPLEQSTGFSQMRKDLRSWAEENYRGEENIEIQLDRADFDSRILQDRDQVLYCVAGALGQSDRETLVFYEATTGTVTGHKVMRASTDMMRDPFKYSDHYQEYKRRSRSTGDIPAMNQNPNWFNAMMASQTGGMPAGPQQNQQNRQNTSDSGEEEDDE